MWDTPLRVVKAGRVRDGTARHGAYRTTLDPGQGAEVNSTVYLVECQPVSLVEEDQGGVRVHVATSWRIITRPGQHITDLTAADGVMVDGIDGVLAVDGEVGQVIHPRIGHSEFTVRRWRG